MKLFLELGNRYAAKSDWKDFALTKLCVCAIGVMIGSCISANNRKKVMAIAGGVFTATYVPWMKKVFAIEKEMIAERQEYETVENI